MSETDTINNLVRKKFNDLGLTYKDAGSREFFRLVKMLDEVLPENEFTELKMKVSRRLKNNRPQFNMDENGYGGDSQPYYQYDSILQNYDEYCADCKSNDQNIPSKEEFAELDNIITGYLIEENFHVPNTMFLTEDDAEEHLKANHYHYSNKASTYVMHAWRAPELLQFLNCLIKYFKIDAQNSYADTKKVRN